MNSDFLDFEQPIAELEAKIEELQYVSTDAEVTLHEEIQRLRAKCKALTKSIFTSLTPWQISQLARHPRRPYTLDYIQGLITDFQELHGDRAFADDPAIVGGIGQFGDQAVIVIGHQKGRDTREKIQRNFGMPKPEGYRKALRLMRTAERFKLPVLTFIDTPGAYPGVDAEERGQSEAIARNLQVMSALKTPIICT
ncbi:MAG: acetyl-CoA carboxylase carboxyl transferase subunit alpha, partial [Pseudomonadota bacterium]|nr:acetyl-CoA carboxylase carboxyl transferase subunit alpha [Pseudomonadota bacterium]